MLRLLGPKLGVLAEANLGNSEHHVGLVGQHIVYPQIQNGYAEGHQTQVGLQYKKPDGDGGSLDIGFFLTEEQFDAPSVTQRDDGKHRQKVLVLKFNF